MKTLTLIRGIPGSGKSTLAKSIQGEKQGYCNTVHYEADMFFIQIDGEYRFDPKKIKDAHNWCQDRTKKALLEGRDVIVSNTFTQLWEMEAYFKIAKETGAVVNVILAQGNFNNVHGVPEDKVEQMRARFEYDVTPLYKKYCN